MADGKTVSHHTRFPPGTKENPLSPERLNAKARDLISPVLGTQKADRLIETVNAFYTVADMRSLRPLVTELYRAAATIVLWRRSGRSHVDRSAGHFRT